MCINPITIKNTYVSERLRERFPFLVDTKYITVPCGKCPECLYKKQSFIVQRAEMMSLTHDVFMATLTYNNESLPVIDIGDYRHAYADIHDLQNTLKLARKYNIFERPFKYLAVNEYGSHTHRPHFHVLFFVEKPEKYENDDVYTNPKYARKYGFSKHDYLDYYASNVGAALLKLWARNVGTNRKPIYKPLCTYTESRGRRNFDFHYVNPYRDTSDDPNNVIFYVTKYCLKIDDWNQKRLTAIKLCDDYTDEEKKYYISLLKNRCLMSKGFGLSDESESYVKSCISQSLDDTRCNGTFTFTSPNSGNVGILSDYYKRKLCTADERLQMYNYINEHGITFDIYNELQDTRTPKDQVLSSYKQRKRQINENSSDDLLEI